MRLVKKIGFALAVVFIVIQFIQPPRNISSKQLPTDIVNIVAVPERVKDILQNSCYDCHSNNTHYPWYSFIQPAAWWMASHIKKGKANLNFSEFGAYSNRKQQSKMQAIVNSFDDRTMPLSSYTMMHKNARLSADDKIMIQDWVRVSKDSLSKKMYTP